MDDVKKLRIYRVSASWKIDLDRTRKLSRSKVCEMAIITDWTFVTLLQNRDLECKTFDYLMQRTGASWLFHDCWDAKIPQVGRSCKDAMLDTLTTEEELPYSLVCFKSMSTLL